MEQLKQIKEQLIAQVQGQMGNLHSVDTKELGEVIDMIKDLSESCYYCAITEAMEEEKREEPYRMYYSGGRYPGEKDSKASRLRDRQEVIPPQTGSRKYPEEIRDVREGQSPIRRKYYMEAKEMNHDKSYKMQQLEQYLNELSHDITEMIQGATPEEIMMLKQKLTTLNDKIM